MFIPKPILIFLLALIIFGAGVFVGRDVEVKPREANRETKGNTIRVTRVIDGDTIELENAERVRYIGIDTPETSDPRKPVQCFGVQAAKKNQELVEGKMVRLEKDIRERDRYARLLRYVYVGDTFVNLELVKQGFARVATFPPDVKYQNMFLEAQKEAREAKRGLWGSTCTTSDVVNAKNANLSTSDVENSGCIIKGNINTKGEKIYHLPYCPYYEKTKIDETRGEKWFCDEDQALAAGFRKALNCP